MGIEVLMQRQVEFNQKVINSIWKSDFSHLGLEIFASPKPKSPIKKRGPNQRTWLAATKDFQSIRLDIYTTDIELAPPIASSIQEQALPKKRKASDGVAPAPTKKPRVERQRPTMGGELELAELPVLRSRAGRVVRRTDKAKAFI